MAPRQRATGARGAAPAAPQDGGAVHTHQVDQHKRQEQLDLEIQKKRDDNRSAAHRQELENADSDWLGEIAPRPPGKRARVSFPAIAKSKPLPPPL